MWDSHAGSKGGKQSSLATLLAQPGPQRIAQRVHPQSKRPSFEGQAERFSFPDCRGSESRSNNVICQVLQLPGLVVPTASCCLDSHWAFLSLPKCGDSAAGFSVHSPPSPAPVITFSRANPMGGTQPKRWVRRGKCQEYGASFPEFESRLLES